MKLKFLSGAFALLLFVPGVRAQNTEALIRHYVDSAYIANPASTGFLVDVELPAKGISWSYAVGYSNRQTKQKLLTSDPVLLSSNTKPYVAATILKLVAQGKLRLGEPVKKLLKPSSAKALAGAGYQPDSITVKNLLSHTSGIRDYVDDDYFKFIGTHKKFEWTRDAQIERAAKEGPPLTNPGDTFRYADVNYLLLTEIIGRVTRKPFYQSMRSILGYRQHHLDHTWFVQMEHKPANTPPLAHQYWDEFGWDTHDLNPSWDLYGGGGMAATIKDMAMYFQDLFNGKIIKDPQVLKAMTRDVPPNLQINYCLGIRKIEVAGDTCYNHGGGLGTDVVYVPALNATVAVAAVEAKHRETALKIREEIVRLLNEER
ncbi:MAG: serine hydrolase domain-containing protein [Ginsengibacter sp.]